MNVQQFISKWANWNESEEMEEDIKMLIENEIEERESWIFKE